MRHPGPRFPSPRFSEPERPYGAYAARPPQGCGKIADFQIVKFRYPLDYYHSAWITALYFRGRTDSLAVQWRARCRHMSTAAPAPGGHVAVWLGTPPVPHATGCAPVPAPEGIRQVRIAGRRGR